MYFFSFQEDKVIHMNVPPRKKISSVADNYARQAGRGPSIFAILILMLLLGVCGGGGWYCYKQVSAKKAAAEQTRLKLERIKTEVASAQAYFVAHPQLFDESLHLAREVLVIAEGSPYAGDVKRLVQSIETAKHDAVEETWKALSQRVADLRINNPREALALLTGYTGLFATELTPRFASLEDSVQKQLYVLDKERKKEERRALQAGERQKSRLADALLQGDYEKADALIDEQGVAGDAFWENARAASALPVAVCQTFTKQLGRTITVGTRKGKMKLMIKKTKNDRVAAERPIIVDGVQSGSRPLVFQFSDLSLGETAKRAATIKTRDGYTMLGLILYQAKQYAKAEQLFLKSRSELAVYLAREAQFQQRDIPDAISQPPRLEVFDPDAQSRLIIL